MRYFIGFMITIGLIIILIVLLLSGGGKPQSKAPVMLLPDYASTDAVARLTIDGKINADQDHNAVRITVGQTDVTYEQMQGYQDTVVNKQVYANNEDAYRNFLYALGRVGFTKGDKTSNIQGGEQGQCPLYKRYVLELNENGKDIERYWATDCGNPKTYQGDLLSTITLFQSQVPDYTSLTQNIQF